MVRLITEFVKGYFATFDDNETQAVSTIPDPPKHRGAVNEDVVESNLFGLSANTRRVGGDDEGELDERALLMFRLTADKRGGAAYIAAAPEKHEPCRELFYIDNGQAIFRVPVFLELPGGQRIPLTGGGGPPQGEAAGFHDDGTIGISGDKRFWAVMQGDGNLVVYKLGVPGNKATGSEAFGGKVMWASNSAE